MQRQYVFGSLGLVAGMALGFFTANTLNRTPGEATSAAPDQVAASQPAANSSELPDVAELLQKAEAEPQNFAAQMRTGDMYAKIERFDKAIEFYLKGVALQPGDLSANLVLANAYFDSAQFEKAAEYYSKAIEISPRDVDARADLAATFVERKEPDYARAITELNSALAIQPDHAPSLYYLAIAHHRKGDASEAQKTLARLERQDPNGELVTRLKQNLASK